MRQVGEVTRKNPLKPFKEADETKAGFITADAISALKSTYAAGVNEVDRTYILLGYVERDWVFLSPGYSLAQFRLVGVFPLVSIFNRLAGVYRIMRPAVYPNRRKYYDRLVRGFAKRVAAYQSQMFGIYQGNSWDNQSVFDPSNKLVKELQFVYDELQILRYQLGFSLRMREGSRIGHRSEDADGVEVSADERS